VIVLTPPLSKSDAQRALILSDIISGPSVLAGIEEASLPSDVRIVRDGLWALRNQKSVIQCHDGGAPFRFLLTQAALTPGTKVQFFGTQRLGERPQQPLLDALRKTLNSRGVEIRQEGLWPIEVVTPEVLGPVDGFVVSGAESSQFASSLLLGAARLVVRQRHPVRVVLKDFLASPGYFEMTCDWLKRTGFVLERDADEVQIETHHVPNEFPSVPGDWASLTYLLPLAWKTQSAVNHVSLQVEHPDKRIVEALSSIGLSLHFFAKETARVVGSLSGSLNFDCALAPDSVPALVAVSLALSKPSTFFNTRILQFKESDRLEGVQRLAKALGAQTQIDSEKLTVIPGHPPAHFEFDSFNDHRLAMAAATASVLLNVSMKLTGSDCVKKSFPNFWTELRKTESQIDFILN